MSGIHIWTCSQIELLDFTADSSSLKCKFNVILPPSFAPRARVSRAGTKPTRAVKRGRGSVFRVFFPGSKAPIKLNPDKRDKAAGAELWCFWKIDTSEVHDMNFSSSKISEGIRVEQTSHRPSLSVYSALWKFLTGPRAPDFRTMPTGSFQKQKRQRKANRWRYFSGQRVGLDQTKKKGTKRFHMLTEIIGRLRNWCGR